MSEILLYSLILLASVFVSSCSQILLKKSANKQYSSKIKEYLNPVVLFAYFLFFGCTFISMYALKVVPLSMAPIIEAACYIFIPLMSFLFLQEKMNKKQFLGMLLIILGILIYAL